MQQLNLMKNNDNFYRSVIHSMKLGYSYHKLLFDKNGKAVDYIFLEVNDAFESIIGIKRENIIGEKASVALNQNLITHLDWIETFENVCKTGRSFSFKVFSEELNKWLDVNVIGNTKDSFTFLFSELNKDDSSVTGLLKDKLKETDSKYRKLFDSANDAIFIVSHGIFIDCNDKTLEVFGCKRDQIVGKSPDYFSPDKQPDGTNSNVSAKLRLDLAKAGKPQFFEWTHKRFDNTPFFAEVSLKSFNLDEKDYILAIVRDVSEKQDIYKKQQSSELFLKFFIKAIPGPVFMMNPDGEIVVANEAHAKRFGLDEQQIIGKNIYEILPEDVAKRRRKYTEKVLRSRKSLSFDDFKDDKYFRYIVHPILDNKGNVSLLAMMVTDITDLKIAEDKLADSNEIFASFMENVDALCFLKEENGKLIYINKCFKNYFGVKDDFLGKTHFDIFPEERAAFIDMMDKKVLAEGVSNYIEHFYDTKGQPGIFDVSVFKIERKGKTPLIGGIGHNITKLKINEERLKKLTIAVDQSANVIMITDVNGDIEYVNPKFTELTGYSIEEVIGENPRILKSGEQPKKFYKNMWKTIISGEEWMGEFHNKKKNGDFYWELSTIAPVKDEKGIITNFIAVKEDITERKKYEAELNKQLAFTRTLLNTIPNAIFYKNSDGIYIGCNSAYENLMNTKEDEINGKTVYEIYPKEYADLFQAKDNEMFERKSIQIYESKFVLNDGIIDVMIYKALYPEGDGKFGIIGAIVDITSVKEIQKNLKQAKEMAEKANTARGEFVAIVSHEIRSPLNGILGMTDLALGLSASKEQSTYLENVKYSAFSLLEIINNILDFSKIEAGKIEIEKIRFDLLDIVENSLQLFAPKCLENDVELLMHIDQEMPRYFIGDPRKIRQVLINLLSNAVKFTMQGEISVNIIIERQNEDQNKVKINFFVNDTGIGIPENKINYIFENFTQGDESTSRVYGGTGLGLSIAKSLVNQMGGDIYVNSQPGIGSSFVFDVELVISEEEKIRDVFSEPLGIKKALIVDDNRLNGIFLKELLELWKINSDVCNSAADGLKMIHDEYISGNPYEIMFVDYKMPSMDGVEMIKKIRFDMQMPDIPIVLMASYSPGQTASNIFAKLNIGFVLNKPLKINELFEGMKNTLLKKTDMDSNLKPGDEIPARPEKFNVLVVEDNPVNKLIVKEYLSRLGCDVVIASDGIEGVEKFQTVDIDLIFMDIHMPKMDGLTATRKIREIESGKSHIPIVALTADAMPGDREKCLEAGMDHYISKPFTIDDLKNAITIMLIEGKL